MDLSKLSTEDLMAMKSGDLSKVSTAGLQVLKSSASAASQAASNPGEYDPKSPEWQARYGATSGMGGIDKFVSGYGKAGSDMVRGIGQLVGQGIDAVAPAQRGLGDLVTGGQGGTYSSRLGLPQQADIDETKRLDAPLMNTGAGMAGNIAGNVAATVPAVAIPGAATLRGAAAVGGALGAIQPVASDESRLTNAAVGAGAGAGGTILGRTLASALAGGKALLEPFSQGGRERIAGRVLNRFADDPATIANASNAPTITGARPTLAEQTGDRGLARLQDSLASVDPQINNQLAGRASENNAARVSTLRGLAGEDGARDFAAAERAGTAKQLYGDAFGAMPDATALTPEQGRTMQTLLRSPAIQAAMKDARAIAANKGTNVGPANGTGSIEGLHNMKVALDDAINTAKASGRGAEAESIKAAQSKLVGLIEELSPDYKSARVTYAQMSKPVNAFDTAADLVKRGLSNGSDLSGNPTINRNALLGAVKDEPALIKRATGRDAAKSLDDLFSPEDLAKLRAVISETDRAGAVASAGNGPGSATAQRMASQNILNQLVGPTGLPQSWAESALANTVIGKPLNLLYGGVAEPRIQRALAEAVLNPDRARQVLTAARIPAAQQDTLLRLVAEQATRSAPGAAAVSGQR